MKTLTKITALIATALIISLNSFAGGFEFQEESYIDDIPMDLQKIEAQIKYEQAMMVEFTFEEEEFINDMVFSDSDLDAQNNYYRAMAVNFEFEEEEYIDDIPCALSDTLVSL